MAADITVRPALQGALPMDDPPGQTVEEGAHAKAKNSREDAAVDGDKRGGVKHGFYLPSGFGFFPQCGHRQPERCPQVWVVGV